jgi:leucyl/phenylalanyl-tRNA--protein transferase
MNETPDRRILLADPNTDTDFLLDSMLKSDYPHDLCAAFSFNPAFIARLMYSGFFIMSTDVFNGKERPAKPPGMPADSDWEAADAVWGYLLLARHHHIRNVLFFDDLHISRSAVRLLRNAGDSFELRADACYDEIAERCVAKHGADWLTPPLLEAMRNIRDDPSAPVRPTSFALFRDGELCAGDLGVKVGAVYTSYSGYHDGNSTGTVQMILTAEYLRDAGFAFWDLGMPLPYKYTLGATDIGIDHFTRIFREGRHGRFRH